MDDDWNDDCVTDSYVCVMTGKANLAHRCSNVMMTLNTLSTVFYFAGSYLSHRMTFADGKREFPVQMQFPFNATESPVFEFIVVGSFLHVWETAVVIAMLNSLILALVRLAERCDITRVARRPPSFGRSFASASKCSLASAGRCVGKMLLSMEWVKSAIIGANLLGRIATLLKLIHVALITEASVSITLKRLSRDNSPQLWRC